MKSDAADCMVQTAIEPIANPVSGLPRCARMNFTETGGAASCPRLSHRRLLCASGIKAYDAAGGCPSAPGNAPGQTRFETRRFRDGARAASTGAGRDYVMKLLAVLLALLSLAGMIFGWWGMETVAGSRQFDEMAGIIPLVTGVVSFILLLVAAGLYYLANR
tara:strand:- start:105774 stop:106259 length:486 start_codon:yes stop_codon:yes gene_type:complete